MALTVRTHHFATWRSSRISAGHLPQSSHGRHAIEAEAEDAAEDAAVLIQEAHAGRVVGRRPVEQGRGGKAQEGAATATPRLPCARTLTRAARVCQLKASGLKWSTIAERLGTNRSTAAVQQHWDIMNGTRKLQTPKKESPAAAKSSPKRAASPPAAPAPAADEGSFCAIM